MKIPRFILGFVSGILLSLCALAFVWHFLFFPVADGFYESAIIPFYVDDDSPHYAAYQKLESPEYWAALSADAESIAKEYCRKNGIYSNIKVHCVGKPQSFQIYYSIVGHTSIRRLFSRHEIEAVIVEHVDSAYTLALAQILPID
jgi:hypothetical protein